QLKIVDPENGKEVISGEVGEIWLSSPSVAAGYWGLPELTEEAFSARKQKQTTETNHRNKPQVKLLVGQQQTRSLSPRREYRPSFLRTGDLARVDGGGRIFISGRIKDLIIVRGRNLYPQ
ncbi:unnamed protein product, partial [Hapterophycus canaliculatus]